MRPWKRWTASCISDANSLGRQASVMKFTTSSFWSNEEKIFENYNLNMPQNSWSEEEIMPILLGGQQLTSQSTGWNITNTASDKSSKLIGRIIKPTSLFPAEANIPQHLGCYIQTATLGKPCHLCTQQQTPLLLHLVYFRFQSTALISRFVQKMLSMDDSGS